MPDKVEIVKQVRLTPKQRITLMEIANEGGSKSRIDHDTATVLKHLELIEHRSRYSPAEKKARVQKRKAMFKEAIELARAGNAKGLNRKADEIESAAYHDDETAYFLTPAAQEYLLQGTVTIKTGPTQKAAADAE
jgi:hypothetical protein